MLFLHHSFWALNLQQIWKVREHWKMSEKQSSADLQVRMMEFKSGMCVDSLEMLRLSHWFHSYIIPYRPWPCSKFVRSENSGKCLRDNLPLICKISRLWSSSAEVARRLSWDHLSIKLHIKFYLPIVNAQYIPLEQQCLHLVLQIVSHKGWSQTDYALGKPNISGLWLKVSSWCCKKGHAHWLIHVQQAIQEHP